MAGVVGVVSRTSLAADLDAGLRSLCHAPWFERQALLDTPNLRLGFAHRPFDGVADHVFDGTVGVGVILYGWAVAWEPSWRRLDASAILRRFVEDGTEALFRLDGGYLVVVADLRARRLVIVNDRTATVPLQYREEDGLFAFAPEAKAIHAALDRPMGLSETGVLSFLNLGYALGDETLLQGVKLLEPAQVVEVSLDTAKSVRRPYWTLRFKPEPMSERDAGERLYEVFTDCHRAVVGDGPRLTQLLLTGGLDSRTVLGFLAGMGRPPDETLTWGVDDQIPHSDPAVAASIAASYGVPFRFARYDADTFQQCAEDWAWVSELGSDNLGSFAAGRFLLGADAPPAAVVLIGDQLLGDHGLPLDRRDALELGCKLPCSGVAPGLEGLIRAERLEEAGSIMKVRAAAIADRCTSESPKDLSDFLGLYVGMARWLNAPAPFREPMASNRRPMVLQPALELFQELPPLLRVDKRALVAMQVRSMPELLRWPRSSANSLVDWGRAFSLGGVASSYFRELVGESARSETVRRYLDPAVVDQALERNYGRPPRELERRPVPERGLTSLRRAMSRSRLASMGLRLAERSARRLRGRAVGASQGRVVVRLALVGLLERCLASRPSPRRDAEGPQEDAGRWRVGRWLPGVES